MNLYSLDMGAVLQGQCECELCDVSKRMEICYENVWIYSRFNSFLFSTMWELLGRTPVPQVHLERWIEVQELFIRERRWDSLEPNSCSTELSCMLSKFKRDGLIFPLNHTAVLSTYKNLSLGKKKKNRKNKKEGDILMFTFKCTFGKVIIFWYSPHSSYSF